MGYAAEAAKLPPLLDPTSCVLASLRVALSITLIAKDLVPLKEIVDRLTAEGVPSLSMFRTRDLRDGVGSLENSSLAIVVSLTQDFIDEAETIDQIRQKLGPHKTLLACILRLPEKWAQNFHDLGAEIISPAGSDTTSIMERIQGHLILAGHVTRIGCEELWGATGRMQKVFADIENYGPLKEAVLIRGETGTGKGLVARALHQTGKQKSKRIGEFKKIEVVALNPNLMESELFGHVKGAFSDAKSNRTGLIEAANDGTAFIDEIGDLSLPLQTKLLGVVEDRVIRRVGDNADKKINARFVFATHRNLEEGMRDKSFRPDLFARINRLVIELPPLREHRADIPLLVKHLLERFNKTNGTEVEIARGAVDELFHYDWPLNVRELDDVVCRAAAGVKSGQQITDVMFRENIRDPRDVSATRTRQYAQTFSFDLEETWPKVSQRAKLEYFTALVKVARNIDHATALSGIQRAQLYKILGEYDLKVKQ